MKKIFWAVLLAVVCVITGKSVGVQAAEPAFKEIPIYEVKDMTNYDQTVGLSWQIDWSLDKDAGVTEQKEYAKFVLKEDSIVRIKMSTLNEAAFAANDYFRLYGNRTMATPLTDNGIDYGKGDDWFLLPAGTYYAECGSKLYMNRTSAHTTKIMIGAIAEDKAVTVTQTPDKAKEKVTVRIKQCFATEPVTVVYKEGKLTSIGLYSGIKAEAEADGGSFTVDKNGWYTVQIQADSTVGFNKALKYVVHVNVDGIKTPAEKGATYKKGGLEYKVLKNGSNQTGTVSVVGMTKNVSSVTIPQTVQLNDYTYKVTKIESKAFYNKSKLKKVTIDSTSITAIGKDAFKGIYKKAVVSVPKAKYTAYSRLLKKAGVKSPMKVEKIKVSAEVGKIYTKNNVQYKVIKNNSNGTGTVYVMGMVKNTSSVTIPKEVKLNDYTYKITKINNKAFYKKSKLKKVVIEATTITSFGKNTFTGIYKKATVYVPEAKYKAYSKKLKTAGVKSPMKIKKQ